MCNKKMLSMMMAAVMTVGVSAGTYQQRLIMNQ